MSLTLTVMMKWVTGKLFGYMRGPHPDDVRAQPHRGQLARPRNKLTDVANGGCLFSKLN